LEIDNNLTENAFRPSAVGKKNWLFIGHHPEAGWRSAVTYSIIVSCRRHGIEPWDYLRDVLTRLPAMKQSEISGLLPAKWKPAFQLPNRCRWRTSSLRTWTTTGWMLITSTGYISLLCPLRG
jgi:hypothetical protein